MRRMISIIFMAVLVSSAAYAEDLTLTTYFPAPSASYAQIRLFPQAGVTGTCDDGTMGVDNSGVLKFCKGGTWGGVAGVWEQNGSQVYLEDKSLWVGIGTTMPQAPLHVTGSSAGATGPFPAGIGLVVQNDAGSDPAWVSIVSNGSSGVSGIAMVTGATASEAAVKYDNNAKVLSFKTNSGENRMTLDDQGKFAAQGLSATKNLTAPYVEANNISAVNDVTAQKDLKAARLRLGSGDYHATWGADAGQGVMYLQNYAGDPANCPSSDGWAEIDKKQIYAGSGMNWVRTCYTDHVCRVMYLQASSGNPAACLVASGWVEADNKQAYVGGLNRVRTCYKCAK